MLLFILSYIYHIPQKLKKKDFAFFRPQHNLTLLLLIHRFPREASLRRSPLEVRAMPPLPIILSLDIGFRYSPKGHSLESVCV